MLHETGSAISVYCACGAQWHGKYTRSEVIADHKKRWTLVEPRPGFNLRGRALNCKRIGHKAFSQRFTCHCPDCCEQRKARYRAARTRTR